MNYEKFNSLSLSLSLLKNKIKQKKEKAVILLLAVLISVLFVSTITYGATTIGSNIDTGGNLTVLNNATLGDDATDLIKSIGSFYASSTLQSTGAARFYSTARIDGATILNSVSYTWPSSDGSASTYLQTNGAGTLSWATVSSGANSDWLKQTNYGVLNLTASTTIPYWAKDAIYASSTLQVQGLTTLANASTTQTSVSSNFYTGLTANSIPFIGTNGLLTQNTSNLIWDNTNTRLGIGTTTPNWLLQVAGTRPFFTLSDAGAAANQKHWFLSSQGGNFYVGTSSDALNATSTYLTITNGGNVGIGTSTPNTRFYVNSVSGNSVIRINAQNISQSRISFSEEGNERWIIRNDDSGDNSLFGIYNNAYGSSVLNIKNSTGLVGINVTDPGSRLSISNNVSIGTNYSLKAAPANGLIVEGSIGIGTSTPNWLLQITSTSPFLAITDTDSGTDLKHWLISNQSGNLYFATSTDSYATSTSNLLNLISSNYSVGIGTTSPTEQLSVSGRLFVGGTGTSTVQNNLYVMGTLRSAVSYVGDLIFSNNFKFIETPRDAKIQSLFLQNQYGEDIFKINENGKVVVREINAKQGNFEEGNFKEKLQIGSPQNRTGITIYDKKTGEPVCVFSENNVLKSSKGECE